MKIFQFPMGICFEKKIKEYLKTEKDYDYFDIIPLNNWVEGSLEKGIVAFYFAVPTENGQTNFRIPIEDVDIFYASATHLIYKGSNEELIRSLVENQEQIHKQKGSCMMFED